MSEKTDGMSRRTFLKAAAGVVAVAAVGSGGYYAYSSMQPQGIDVPDTEVNMKMCICPDCPSFKGSPLTGGFFCAKGKAKETVKQLGCICPRCPVTAKYGLKTGYFCVKGKSRDVPQ
ncbi:MAG: DUF2769 domain-containing protein [archaeon]